jgi:hypothetical protein
MSSLTSAADISVFLKRNLASSKCSRESNGDQSVGDFSSASEGSGGSLGGSSIPLSSHCFAKKYQINESI